LYLPAVGKLHSQQARSQAAHAQWAASSWQDYPAYSR